MICFLLDKISPYFSTTKSRTKMGRARSGPEIHVNFVFGSGWVTSPVGRVVSGQENWTHVQLRAIAVVIVIAAVLVTIMTMMISRTAVNV